MTKWILVLVVVSGCAVHVDPQPPAPDCLASQTKISLDAPPTPYDREALSECEALEGSNDIVWCCPGSN